MRIAMIGQKGIPASYGGIERHVEEIGALLVERGHSVRVYTRPYYAGGSKPHRGMERVPKQTLRTKHLDTPSHTALATLDALAHPVDIVHYHALGPAALSWAPHLRGMGSVVTLHGLDWEREKWGKLATYLLQHCEYPAAHCPDRTIAVSRTLQRYFEEKYRIRPDYVPNGVGLPIRRPAELLEPWGVEPGKYFLFVGRLTPEKGAHLLLEAFGRLRTDRKLVIAGGSSFTDDYVASLHAAAPPNTVFTGYVHGEQLEALWSHAYSVVLPSTLEGLSIALLEGLSFERCTLVSDIPENLEVVGEDCPSFASDNVDALTEALTALDRNPDRVAAYERTVAADLAHRFQWGTVVDQVEAIYREILVARQGGSVPRSDR